MKSQGILLFPLMVMSLASGLCFSAEPGADSESQALLSSWGLQQDEKGKLHFSQELPVDFIPWQPDYSVFDHPVSAGINGQASKPVVINADQ